MTLLWPELPPEPAQVNLRQIVYQLRHAIPDADGRHSNEQVPFVVGDRYTIGINPDADFEADVMRRDGCCTRNSACRRRLIPRLAEWIKADSLESTASRPTVVRGYELLDELGAGAVGRVYRALQPGVGREVAVKIIRPRYANHPDYRAKKTAGEAHLSIRA